MRLKRPEQALQIAIVTYLRARLPKPWLVLHVPNGGSRSKVEAAIFKAMGVLAGFPDLLVIGPGGWTYPTIPEGKQQTAQVIAIEIKAPPRRLPSGGLSKAAPAISPAQRAVLADLGACGVPTIVARDLDETVRALAALGVPFRGRAA